MSTVASKVTKVASSGTKKAVSRAKREVISKPQGKHSNHSLQGVSESLIKKHPISSFQARVYAMTQDIPIGYVTTYGAIAKLLHSSPRAVGQALRRNPFAPTVPCHRVIALTGLGGFFGCVDGEQMDKKFALLQKEGVELSSQKTTKEDPLNFSSAVVDESRILSVEALESKLLALKKGYTFTSAK